MVPEGGGKNKSALRPLIAFFAHASLSAISVGVQSMVGRELLCHFISVHFIPLKAFGFPFPIFTDWNVLVNLSNF
jgi:hypothetical protein